MASTLKKPHGRRTAPAIPRSLARHYPEVAHPHQAVGRHLQDELEVHLLAADKSVLAQATGGLRPTEAFLAEFAETLGGDIAGLTGRAPIVNDDRLLVFCAICAVTLAQLSASTQSRVS